MVLLWHAVYITVLIWVGGQMNKQDDCRLWLIPNKVKECVARLSE